MKKHISALVLTVLIVAVCISGCGTSQQSSNLQPETQTQTRSDVSDTTAENTTADTTSATEETQSTSATTKSKTKVKIKTSSSSGAVDSATQPATVQSNVPANSITGANINPNLNAIQNRVDSEWKALQVRAIHLESNSLELEVGETVVLSVAYSPENAMYKQCTASVNNGCVSVSSSNSNVTVKGKSAGTCVLTVTSKNGHKATCNITVKRNESITDDTALPHSDLCTADNVAKWTAAITAKCAELGMTQDATLKGFNIIINTDDNKGQTQSFNEVKSEYVQKAEAQLQSAIDGEYSDYTFNCYSEPQDDGEYYIYIVVNKEEE